MNSAANTTRQPTSWPAVEVFRRKILAADRTSHDTPPTGIAPTGIAPTGTPPPESLPPESPAPESPASNASPGRLPVRTRVLVAVGFALTLGGLSLLLRDQLSLTVLLEWEQQLRGWQRTHPLVVYFAAFALYVIVTGASLPGATPMSLAYAWYFGFLPAAVLISFASTSGATLAFLSSRYLLRDAVQSRFGGRLRSVNDAIRREGVYYLITVRLIPGIPFVVINLLMGLTPIGVGTFWWASQLGMLPGTLLYVWVGSAFPDLQTLVDRGVGSVVTPEIVAAFLCLALFPLGIRWLVASGLLSRWR